VLAEFILHEGTQCPLLSFQLSVQNTTFVDTNKTAFLVRIAALWPINNC
jgi:hypothetical protein